MGFYSILIYTNWIKLGFDGDELIWIFTRGVTNKAVGVCVCVCQSLNHLTETFRQRRAHYPQKWDFYGFVSIHGDI